MTPSDVALLILAFTLLCVWLGTGDAANAPVRLEAALMCAWVLAFWVGAVLIVVESPGVIAATVNLLAYSITVFCTSVVILFVVAWVGDVVARRRLRG